MGPRLSRLAAECVQAPQKPISMGCLVPAMNITDAAVGRVNAGRLIDRAENHGERDA